MFTIAVSDPTPHMLALGAGFLLIILSIVFSLTIAKKIKRYGNLDIWVRMLIPMSALVIFLIIAAHSMLSVSDEEEAAYATNIASVENYFNDQYSGEFTVVEPVGGALLKAADAIDFDDWKNVEDRGTIVDRKLDGVIYSYRLAANADGNPELFEIVDGDNTGYAPLTK